MITALKVATWILVITTIVGLFFDPVTELPFGMDEALTFFVSTIRALIELLPWLGIVWNVIVLSLFIKGLLFTWHWIVTVIHLVRS